VTEKKQKKSNPHTDMGTPHIGMGRDMSIFQIGESPYQYGVHSNLGTDIYSSLSSVVFRQSINKCQCNSQEQQSKVDLHKHIIVLMLI
jgi:hypothetical protein